MARSISARIGFFLFARTHAQLQYYFSLTDSRRASNDPILTPKRFAHAQAKIVPLCSRRGLS